MILYGYLLQADPQIGDRTHSLIFCIPENNSQLLELLDIGISTCYNIILTVQPCSAHFRYVYITLNVLGMLYGDHLTSRLASSCPDLACSSSASHCCIHRTNAIQFTSKLPQHLRSKSTKTLMNLQTQPSIQTDCVKYEIYVPTDLHNYLLSTIMAKQV